MNSNGGGTTGDNTLRGRGKEAPKRIVFKTVFDSPYSQWPVVEQSLGKELLTRTLSELAPFTSLLSQRRSMNKSDTTQEPKQKKRKTDTPTLNPISVGVNQVTRLLEKKCASVVLACRDDLEYGQVLNHLPFQCRLAGCLLVPLPRGSASELSSLLNIPRISVIGIPNHTLLPHYLEYLEARVPRLQGDLSTYQSLTVHRVPVNPRDPLKKPKIKCISRNSNNNNK